MHARDLTNNTAYCSSSSVSSSHQLSQSLFPATISTTLNVKQSPQQRNSLHWKLLQLQSQRQGRQVGQEPKKKTGREAMKPPRNASRIQTINVIETVSCSLILLCWSGSFHQDTHASGGRVGWGGVGPQRCARNQTAPKARFTLKNKGKTT